MSWTLRYDKTWARRLVYTTLYGLWLVAMGPRTLLEGVRHKTHPRWLRERLGLYSRQTRDRLAVKREPRCWINAVSVGELHVALAFVRVFGRRFPGHRIVLTTTTLASHALARELLSPGVELLYFPFDLPWCVRRAFEVIQPDIVVLTEMEVWPNHVTAAARRGVPIVLINGWLPDALAEKYRRVRGLMRQVFGQLALACVQDREDARAFESVGVPARRVHVTGNIKYDASMPPPVASPRADAAEQALTRRLRQLGVGPSRLVLVAGSTHRGEEAILFDLLSGLRGRFPDLLLVVAPRNVERIPEIAALARRKRLTFALHVDAESAGSNNGPADCLLVNTMGELVRFYRAATVIFVGKSLVGRGGQNIIEAAASGHPVVFGPHMDNFRSVAHQLLAEGAGVQVQDARELRRAVEELLAAPDRRERIAAAAMRVIEANRGTAERTLEVISAALRPDRHRRE